MKLRPVVVACVAVAGVAVGWWAMAEPRPVVAAITTVPGMPPVADPANLYSEIAAGKLSPAVQGALQRVYVPNRRANTVSVIDPETLQVVDTFKVGRNPQHVVPSWDLKTLWVANNAEGRTDGSLTPIDPWTGKPGPSIAVDDPYNVYSTPDGKSVIVVAEELKRLDFRDPTTLRPQFSIATPRCGGINHADFSIDGRYALFTCEFDGAVTKIDMVNRTVVGTLTLSPYWQRPDVVAQLSAIERKRTEIISTKQVLVQESPELGGAICTSRGMPQDVRVSPDGKLFFVADMLADGVHVVDGDSFKQIGFIPTGTGAHGLYPSRDGKKNEGLASLQQLTAARGGTLGIMSVTPIDGLQANIDTQLLGQNANLYAQLGGLQISQRVSAEAFAELMEEDVPRFLLSATPRKEIPTTKLTTAGLRVRRVFFSALRVTEIQSSECMDALRTFERSPKDVTSARSVNAECATKDIFGSHALSLSAGARLLRRSALDENGEASLGGAFEMMGAYERSRKHYTHRLFVGISGMRIKGATDMLGTDVVELPKFTSLRISAGYEFCGSQRSSEADLLPRVGVYAMAMHAWWRDPYTNGTAEPRIQGSSLEVGAYLGGRFQKNFQGMIAARVLKPLGSDELTFILSLVPGGNSAPQETN